LKGGLDENESCGDCLGGCGVGSPG
jgi:hypothetical protein